MSRVVANLCWMVPGAVGGSEEYATRLLRAVADRSDDAIDVGLAGMNDLGSSHPDLARNFEVSCAPVGGSARPIRLALESSWLAWSSRGADLVHHFGGHIPMIHHAPAMVTIHDTQPVDMPANFSPLKRAYMHRMLPRTVAAAELICTPSAWVAQRVVECLGADPAKLRVIPSTWEDRTTGQEPDEPTAIDLLQRLEGCRVVLYPAVTHPHKNHVVLLEAAAKLIASIPSLRLVLTGAAGRSHDEVVSAVSRLRLGDVVLQPGRVSAGTLTALMHRADVLAFPSVYEGFGLPVLEAMRCGTPVVAADAAALPEVLDGAGITIPAGDVDMWTEALEAALVGGSQTTGMVEAGLARSEFFSPADSAGRLLDVWKEAVR